MRRYDECSQKLTLGSAKAFYNGGVKASLLTFEAIIQYIKNANHRSEKNRNEF